VAITVRFRFRLWLTIPDVTWTSYELYHTEKQATLRLSREIAFFYFFNALLMRTDVNLERNQKHVIRFKNSSLENCAETMSITGCFLRANKLKARHKPNTKFHSTSGLFNISNHVLSNSYCFHVLRYSFNKKWFSCLTLTRVKLPGIQQKTESDTSLGTSTTNARLFGWAYNQARLVMQALS